jgi:hypothetical protein
VIGFFCLGSSLIAFTVIESLFSLLVVGAAGGLP